MPKKKSRKKAFAISREQGAAGDPTVHAAGGGRIAERIIELARQNGIPVNEDPDMVELLSRLNIEAEIPPELYPIVGEALGFAYRVNDALAEAAADPAPPKPKLA